MVAGSRYEGKVFLRHPGGLAGGVRDFGPGFVLVDNEHFRAVAQREGGLGVVERDVAGDGLVDHDDGGFLKKALIKGEPEAAKENDGESGQRDGPGQAGFPEGGAKLAGGERQKEGGEGEGGGDGPLIKGEADSPAVPAIAGQRRGIIDNLVARQAKVGANVGIAREKVLALPVGGDRRAEVAGFQAGVP